MYRIGVTLSRCSYSLLTMYRSLLKWVGGGQFYGNKPVVYDPALLDVRCPIVPVTLLAVL